ncbi:hypothetical protein Pse7367_2210 [Thalassoporum mexicanum PCC 7367]|uniref:hypothetical protein n=1 Tax=Thalassoporum mexicanum TaxID=3457544 RepID=UPI00029F9533|nr:hypothetical protein [Pseudanabaena sp. PCC 7367]AFY70474.1 hypothetical protein Pse7367_2210 [Pseudanabaena sp. PCC 7367]
MTKFQFLLVASLLTSLVCLLMGSRDVNPFGSVLPIASIMAIAYFTNRYLSEALWNKFAIWANHLAERRIFKVRKKRIKQLPPARARRLR